MKKENNNNIQLASQVTKEKKNRTCSVNSEEWKKSCNKHC